jgi:hypothetical protein
MRHWTFWEWVAYGALFVAAMIIAADTGVRITPELAAHLPSFIHGFIWGVTPIAFVLVATAILLLQEFVIRPQPQSEMTGTVAPKPIPTSLRLQFNPNSITPTNLHLENIWYWYALCHIFTAIEGPSKAHKKGRQIETKQWTIFLIFDQPVAIKQILVDGNGAKLPLVEVKDRGPRHAIITINGDVGAAVIDVRVVV